MPYKDALARRESQRRRYRVNREKINSAERRRRAENPQAFRETKLRHRYGITHEQYAALLESQDGLCALCRERAAVDIDHDHKTGKVRAMLCRACNIGIGFFQENADLLRAAIEYLAKHASAG